MSCDHMLSTAPCPLPRHLPLSSPLAVPVAVRRFVCFCCVSARLGFWCSFRKLEGSEEDGEDEDAAGDVADCDGASPGKAVQLALEHVPQQLEAELQAYSKYRTELNLVKAAVERPREPLTPFLSRRLP